jgi:hypothetical protein
MNDAANHLAALLKEANQNNSNIVAVVAGVTVTIHPENVGPDTKTTVDGSGKALHLGQWNNCPADLKTKFKAAVDEASNLGKICAIIQVDDISVFLSKTNDSPQPQPSAKSKSKAPAHPKRDRSTFRLN